MDLKKKGYRKVTVQNFEEDQKSTRKNCYQSILKNIDRDKLQWMMFIDEDIFTRNACFNSQNDVVWADDRTDVNKRCGLYQLEKYPAQVMIALGVAGQSVTRPYFS